jgi:hypothetical protein
MKNLTTDPRRRVRRRIPVAYASLLIIALVAVVGFAAFSPSYSSTDVESTTVGAEASTAAAPMSARIASAVLAIRVADPDTRTATTQTAGTDSAETGTADAPSTGDDAADDAQVAEDTAIIVEETTTVPPQAAVQSAPADTTPPSFKITSPNDGDTVKSTIVEFKGTVEKGAGVRSGPFEATVNDDGTWSISLAVVAGANGASITATDAAGNTSSERIVVHYSPPQTTTTTKAAATTTTKATSSTAAATTTTTKATSSSTSSTWSPNWPADAGGIRDVEAWRPLVARYWAADRVDCVLGIIKRESGGDPTAYNSSYGASGLMQHLIKYWPGRAASAGFKDSNGLVASPFNGEANIAAGAAIAGSGSDWYAPWSRLPTYGSCSG